MQSPLEAPAKSLYGQSGLHSSCPNRSTHQKSLGFELLSRRKGDTQSPLIEEFSKLVGFKQGNSTWGLCSLQSFCRLCFCELWVVSIPMRNSTDSKCNGKRKQYFKDIGDSETLPWFSSLLVMPFIPPLLAGDMNLIIPATQPPNEKQQLPSRSKSAWNQRADSGFSETPFNVVTVDWVTYSNQAGLTHLTQLSSTVFVFNPSSPSTSSDYSCGGRETWGV